MTENMFKQLVHFGLDILSFRFVMRQLSICLCVILAWLSYELFRLF